MTPTHPTIRFAGVSKAFRQRDGSSIQAVQAIDLDVPARQFVAVVGPSGCGKSTLLRLADGLITPDMGTVTIDGAAPVPGPRIGFVFQNFRLLPWRSVLDNVGFALEGSGYSPPDRRDRAMAQLRKVGLEAWADQYPAQLSGGMKQRVALARALVGDPDILLMDEPFASLDAQTRELMQEDLLRLHAERQPTVLFVTHSVDEALLLADRIIVMGRGAVLDDIEVDLPRPRSIEGLQGLPAYATLRARLWSQIRHLVLSDPASAFFGRQPG
ncbi:ABC transporter ATP-binding protein [Devosia sediminis]|uniref:ABC transporter ATP-binding protein n=1 Tax=Devosia sediminis TaxID=2798801 RepID=A0A934MH07_9HYPH|nr:ABC transporter ATP-binding protein [Devosia sediminis]MBJ3784517.1 ABC transporter ATP-binding protein [Devosia sediminis]